ncbi:MAG: beta-N-acetylhexosaminidase, partial [Proteobacteria bacterium]|nr:beta-N-acetylhexosaminidase [Pseudomonadota bacterium]
SEGTTLTADEKAFFRDVNPYGYILFARHCESPEGVKRLVGELKSLSGRDRLPILIDQEGGRVARLKPPHWRKYPPASVFADMALTDRERAHQATYLNARLIAQDLFDLGITVDCAPLADLPVAGAHDIIGDRAFGNDAERIIYLGRAMAAGLMDGGVVPVLKHIPGHGRAASDSHLELPVVRESLDVLRATDFVPFKALSNLPMGMTAHIVYTAIDAEHMATQSKKVIELIRSELGFKGLLMSDDISMKAMTGSLADRARRTLDAGCDVVLHCNATLAEKQEAANGLRPLEGQALSRAIAGMNIKPPSPFDRERAIAQLDGWLQSAAA